MNESITIDQSAKDKLKEIASENQNRCFFRIYVTGGGCSGFQYGFNFEKEHQDDDFLIKDIENFFEIIIDPISFQYIIGSTLYYEIGLMGQHFTIANPNAKSTCGCGTSFDI